MTRASQRRRASLPALGLALVLLPGGALAHAAGARPTTEAHSATAAARTVTLVTGDRVTVTGLGQGRSTVSVRRPRGATGGVRTETVDGHVSVVPDEARPYLAAGTLDRRLFDVTALLAQGFATPAGEKPAGLPLIVTGTAARSARSDLPGARQVRALPAVRGEALRAAPDTRLWSALTTRAGEASGRSAKGSLPYARPGRVVWHRTSRRCRKALVAPLRGLSGALRCTAPDHATSSDAHMARTPKGFAAGVGKVWLDAKVTSALAESNQQIGTSAAWDAGLTGKGVRVAVLDTGIDTAHPDLRGRVSASKSFIEGEEIADRNGHGTHTTSTVGGSGAASDGKEKGVAPEADLVVGKVLSDAGEGSESQIIAGMQWAAQDAKARIVSLSLGSQEPSDGTDPMAQAVNTLSEQTGALFVVAAGNSTSPGSIGSPGAADDALTVGAVDSADQLAYFSSQGPRYGDNALKPDICAPGVDILAARSGLTAGEGDYVEMSGTSMATPQVAGVAALLAQQHPDWDGARLKDALMSTSHQLDASPYALGAGRVSVPDAVGSAVTATGSADLGFHAWPHEDDTPVTRTLTYRNDGDAPVTLHLRAEGAPAAAVTLADDSLTVPAHGSAHTTLTGDPGPAPTGQTSGRVVAEADGKAVAHTAFGMVKEEERYSLTIHVKNRDGAPVAAALALQTLAAGGDTFPETVGDSGTLRLRLAPGSYAVSTFLDVHGSHGKDSLGLGYLTDPQITLDRDREITLDGRTLREISTDLPRAAQTRQLVMEAGRTANGSTYTAQALVPPKYDSIFAAPSHKPATGTFEYRTVWRLGKAPLTVHAGGTTLGEAYLPGGTGLLDGTLSAPLLDAGAGTPADYAGKEAEGRAVLVHADGTATASRLAQNAVDAGAAALFLTDDVPGRLTDFVGDADYADRKIPVATLNAADGARLAKAAARGAKAKLTGDPYPPYVYDLSQGYAGAIPAKDLTIAPRGKDLATVDTTYYAPRARTGGEFRYSITDAFPVGVGFPERASYPGKRTDYVTAAPGQRWHESLTVGEEGSLEERGGLVAYPGGTHTALRWFQPVWHPWLGGGLGWGQTRTGDDLAFNTPGFGDSGTDHTGFGDVWSDTSLTQTTQVQVDGETVAKATSSGINLWDADPAVHTYKVITDTSLDPGVWGLGTKGHTAWEVRSAHTPADVRTTLPVINLGFDVDTALDGTVPAGRRLPVGLHASYVTGAASTGTLTTGALSVSYDSGHTWVPVDLSRKGAKWTGTLRVPRGATGVSLRAAVHDDQGGSVTQVLTDALRTR
ncbi:S8 family serine peptidase [Streptomyces sp. NPDC059740]|uniref:S8 family serine peptidase n=1 Tax=Streptomyces sp. NPDC059740 TaxID=3346926 RepID=UPI00364D8995